ncbi:MAG: 5-methyltetrahydropteroyltriglutamate--homocysteine S-methyltransferase [Thermomicrobiales bacterium]|nr:5-methyltetrahydropteroyltriglutamate--homocysteine S-methyltransferase [Thermomicrobiales bacterium]
MAISSIPGYPCMGPRRELKWALEKYWSGARTAEDLAATARAVRAEGWRTQRDAGIDLIPVNDFSFYDPTLDAAVLVGAVPGRYGSAPEPASLDTYFAMARGRDGEQPAPALEMTKWFDTNYHYLVPELTADQQFRLASDKPFAELAEATAAGIPAKPVLLGPLTFLLLAKQPDGERAPLALLDRLLPVYAAVIQRLADAGAAWIQLDEPALVLDRTPDELAALGRAYALLAEAKGSAKLLVQTAYGHVGEAYPMLAALPVDGIGLDLTRSPENLALLERHGFPADKWLAAGVVDGRNIWGNDLAASLDLLDRVGEYVSTERLMVSASCSLRHVPYDVRREAALDPELAGWLAFAEQKLSEIALLTRAVNDGRGAIAEELAANAATLAGMRDSPRRRDSAVRARTANLTQREQQRESAAPERAAAQAQRIPLPPLPTTTIGSFPQTPQLRAERKRFEQGEIDATAYDAFLREQIREVVRWQEAAGLDVLVHGEPERNDMVQYFGEQLAGFAFTQHGWVQSYGSRMVRPPIIYGDVSRPAPMTVAWAVFAQSLSDRPVKGMLTGPVTILNWSFVRDDQPRAETCRQIALAIRDEVTDLDMAGIAVIQIDEPALREGLPLRHAEQDAYLEWATACFRIAASAARDETQIHTHMCYSEFGEVIDAIAALDADVISIENARSNNELLRVFRREGYDKGIGPGVYDIHSPRVPSEDELLERLHATLEALQPGQVWVNPDCGLKTRRWEEVRPALTNMVAAARRARTELAAKS